jgi:hypothetical protein
MVKPLYNVWDVKSELETQLKLIENMRQERNLSVAFIEPALEIWAWWIQQLIDGIDAAAGYEPTHEEATANV